MIPLLSESALSVWFVISCLFFQGKWPEKNHEKHHSENQTPKSTTNLREGVSMSKIPSVSEVRKEILWDLFVIICWGGGVALFPESQ